MGVVLGCCQRLLPLCPPGLEAEATEYNGRGRPHRPVRLGDCAVRAPALLSSPSPLCPCRCRPERRPPCPLVRGPSDWGNQDWGLPKLAPHEENRDVGQDRTMAARGLGAGSKPGSGGWAGTMHLLRGGRKGRAAWNSGDSKEGKCLLGIKEVGMYLKHWDAGSGMSERPWVLGRRVNNQRKCGKDVRDTSLRFNPRLREKEGDKPGHCQEKGQSGSSRQVTSSRPQPSRRPRKTLLRALLIQINPGLSGWRINRHREMGENREG